MYSFGAMLSFTVAHAAVIQLQRRYPNDELGFRAWPNLRFRGVDWPLFAVFGGTATALAWLVVVAQSPGTRYAGLAWLLLGFASYFVYRRRIVREPLTETVRAPIPLGPSVALEYRNVLVPVVWRSESEEAVDLACGLATERGAAIVALTVVEVPLNLPLDAPLPAEAEERAHDLLDEARAIGDVYGVDVIGRIVRGRRAGRAIVDEAQRRNSEIIVMGAPRRDVRRRSGRIFGDTVDFVLKHAPCRVMVAAAPRAA
jgi:APA family basic amino acid/polyamine antiporter